MMTRYLSALLLLAPALIGSPAAAEHNKMMAVPYADPPKTEMVAVPTPTVLVSGRVLMKDGVTPVGDAELAFTGIVDEATRKARTERSGKFKIGLPVGQHMLQIGHRMEIYKSPSAYRVVAGTELKIDFLLVPDFEHPADGVPEPATRRRGPDPIPEAPVVVGSVVDMVQASEGGSHRSWKELLGFLGGILAVAVAAD